MLVSRFITVLQTAPLQWPVTNNCLLLSFLYMHKNLLPNPDIVVESLRLEPQMLILTSKIRGHHTVARPAKVSERHTEQPTSISQHPNTSIHLCLQRYLIPPPACRSWCVAVLEDGEKGVQMSSREITAHPVTLSPSPKVLNHALQDCAPIKH